MSNSLCRTCFTCSTEHPLDDPHFARSRKKGDGGFVFECRTCAAARTKRWRQTHRAAQNAQLRRRRKRERATPGVLTDADRQMLLDAAGHACQSCGDTSANLIFEHVIPVGMQGSSHGPENRQVLCMPCNQRKSTDCTDYRHDRMLVAA